MTLRALPSAVSCLLPAVAGFLVAGKIDRDTGLLQVAIDNLERWAHMDEHVLPPALVEWQELIARHTWPELRAILVQDTDEG